MNGLVLAAAAVGLLALQDNDNPEYKRWSSCKVGSFVKFKSEIEAGGNKVAVPNVITRTLIELGEKQAVVEEVIVTEVAGANQEKPEKRTYAAKTRRQEKVEAEGDEEIEIAGKKMTCHWVEVKSPAASSKTWIHPDVPGGTVRMDLSIGAARNSITRLVATSWEKK